MKLFITSILSMLISFASLAQYHGHVGASSHEEYQGPYARDVASDANVAQEIVHVLDNATVGSVQSVVGAGHIIFYFLLNSAAHGDFEVEYKNVLYLLSLLIDPLIVSISSISEYSS